jgi:outer membrane protein OmpA-like peptidoglycan-associated protein
MAYSIIEFLTGLRDRHELQNMAARLGESKEAVSRALGPAFAVILTGMASKANDTVTLDGMFVLTASVPADSLNTIGIGELASGRAANSALFDSGRQLLAMLFAGNQVLVAEAIERDAGLVSASGGRLLAAAASMLLGYLSERVRAEGFSVAGFARLLRTESGVLSSYLPPEWDNRSLGSFGIGPRPSRTQTAGKRSLYWILPVLILPVTIAWLMRPGQSGKAGRATTAIGKDENRARKAAPGLGGFIVRGLPNGERLTVPENGVESRLLSFLEDPGNTGGSSPWLDFDRLFFDSASAIPRGESEEQIRNIATILKAYPTVRLKIGGYTDNKGNPEANLRLSENRAEAVKRELHAMGIAKDRLEAEGYGHKQPIAHNSIEQGSAANRRISMKVLQK